MNIKQFATILLGLTVVYTTLGIEQLSLRAVPLFESCAYYLDNATELTKPIVKFKKSTEIKWQEAFMPRWISEQKVYRGSIVNLQENCNYELSFWDGEDIVASQKFTTWSSDVPVAKTVVLNSKNFKDKIKITESGTPEGWIRYVAEPNFVLQNSGQKPLIELDGVKYIILDSLTLIGGDARAIWIKNCENIRILNCDISGWGIEGVQRFDLDGKFYLEDKAINRNGAIYLTKSKNTVVERCYIHDPRNRANSWYYSHPAGPQAMMIDSPESTVIRFNDFIGSDSHRYNDVIEGTRNHFPDGGFNHDADIYGNMLTMANDDCIEIDGGQQNVRVYLNKMENALCAISIQGCMEGPSYLFRNLLVNIGDEFGFAGQVIKTSMKVAGKDAVSYIFNNVAYGKGTALPQQKLLEIRALNNIFATSVGLKPVSSRPKGETDYNLVLNPKEKIEENGIVGKDPKFVDPKAGIFQLKNSSPAIQKGKKIANFTVSDKNPSMGAFEVDDKTIIPYRPLDLSLNKYQLNYKIEAGSTTPQTIIATAGDSFSGKFKVRQTNADKWLKVSPSSGEFKPNQKIEFTVSVDPALMTEQINYRSTFLIRMEDGLSRPVSIYAVTDLEPKLKPEKAGSIVTYIDLLKPTKGTPELVVDQGAANGKAVKLTAGSPAQLEYTFDVPKSGVYHVHFRAKSGNLGDKSIKYGIDDQKRATTYFFNTQVGKWWWYLSGNTDNNLNHLKPYKLTQGKHTIVVEADKNMLIDLIAITDDPTIFEQR